MPKLFDFNVNSGAIICMARQLQFSGICQERIKELKKLRQLLAYSSFADKTAWFSDSFNISSSFAEDFSSWKLFQN